MSNASEQTYDTKTRGERIVTPGAGLPEHEEAAKSLRKSFGGRRFADEANLLDYEGAEFILVGIRENLEPGPERN